MHLSKSLNLLVDVFCVQFHTRFCFLIVVRHWELEIISKNKPLEFRFQEFRKFLKAQWEIFKLTEKVDHGADGGLREDTPFRENVDASPHRLSHLGVGSKILTVKIYFESLFSARIFK